MLEIGYIVEIELQNIPEAISKGACEIGKFGRRSDESKSWYIHFHTRRTRTRTDHDIDLKILHGGVQHFFDLGS